MSVIIPFVKMHGLGNDFVIVQESYITKEVDIAKFVQEISHRKIGIGCDQFITYRQKNNNIDMVIYNQDGSRAKACGNASRCLTRLIFDKTGYENININVDGRKVSGFYIDKYNIKVDMGLPVFSNDWMPNSNDLWHFAQLYRIDPKEILCVDVANPHLVIFTKFSLKDMEVIGKNLQESDLFPDGVNVNFAKIVDNKIKLQVWERGVGFTYACGSGAIATFAAASKLGFCEDDLEIEFKLGSLMMQKEQDRIFMTGSASYVFSGEYSYAQ
jgi:diaminopimelate epimerase